MKKRTKVVGGITFLSVALFIGSCSQGFDVNESFSSGVSNAQLESPASEKIIFSKVPGSDTPQEQVAWPVVHGAGGYLFTLYNMDDPANPVKLYTDTIDGVSTIFQYDDDTNYKVELTTLGDAKQNNKDALTASVASWSSLVPATVIPDGTDLFQYFNENPIPADTTQYAYEMVENGHYTASGDLNFGAVMVTLRGTKVNPPILTMDGSFVSTGGGMIVKYMTVVKTSNAPFISYSSSPDNSFNYNGTGVYVSVGREQTVQQCNVYGLASEFITANGKKYGFESLSCLNSHIFLAPDVNASMMFNLNQSFIVHLNVKNSTFADPSLYNKANVSYAMQLGNNRPDKYGYGKGDVTATIDHTTFYGLAGKGNFFNTGQALSQDGNTLVFTNNLFYESGNSNTYGKFGSGSAHSKMKASGNAWYWSDSSITTGDGNNPITVNPGFAALDPSSNPATWAFVPTASDIVTAQCGDTSWYN